MTIKINFTKQELAMVIDGLTAYVKYYSLPPSLEESTESLREQLKIKLLNHNHK